MEAIMKTNTTETIKIPLHSFVTSIITIIKSFQYFLDKESRSSVILFLNTPRLRHKSKAPPTPGKSLGWNYNHHPLSDFSGLEAFKFYWKKPTKQIHAVPWLCFFSSHLWFSSCVISLEGEGGNACWLLPFNYSLLDGRAQAERLISSQMKEGWKETKILTSAVQERISLNQDCRECPGSSDSISTKHQVSLGTGNANNCTTSHTVMAHTAHTQKKNITKMYSLSDY